MPKASLLARYQHTRSLLGFVKVGLEAHAQAFHMEGRGFDATRAQQYTVDSMPAKSLHALMLTHRW